MAGEAVAELAGRVVREWQEEPSGPEDGAAAPDPSDIVALTALVNAQRHADVERAAALLALRFPGNPFGWRMWSLALSALGRDAEALDALHQIARLCPQDAESLDNLGLAYAKQGRLVVAEAAFARALQRDPRKATALSNLGMALERQGRLAEAEDALRRCVQLDGGFHVARLNLGVVLDQMGRADEAEAAVRGAIALHPKFAQAHNSLGYLLKDKGQLEEAEACMRKAIALAPDDITAHHNLLFVLNYHPDKTAEEIFAAYRDFDARFGVPQRAHWQAHRNDHDPARRLRVG
jgi:Flp pilus assembly protein TadD